MTLIDISSLECGAENMFCMALTISKKGRGHERGTRTQESDACVASDSTALAIS